MPENMYNICTLCILLKYIKHIISIGMHAKSAPLFTNFWNVKSPILLNRIENYNFNYMFVFLSCLEHM